MPIASSLTSHSKGWSSKKQVLQLAFSDGGTAGCCTAVAVAASAVESALCIISVHLPPSKHPASACMDVIFVRFTFIQAAVMEGQDVGGRMTVHQQAAMPATQHEVDSPAAGTHLS